MPSLGRPHVALLALFVVFVFCISGCGSSPGAIAGSTANPPGSGGGNGSGAGSDSCGASSAAAPAITTEYLYVGAQPYLFGYTVQTSTGLATLSQSFGGSGRGAGRVSFMAATNPAKFLYAFDTYGSELDGYSIGANGTLTPLNVSQLFGDQDLVTDIALTPDGTVLYVSQADRITGFQVDQSTGQLTPLPVNNVPGATGAGPGVSGQLVIDPSGRFAYATLDVNGMNGISAGILAYSIDPATKTLTPLANSPFMLGSSSGSISLAMDPTGNFLYAALSGRIVGFSRDSTTGNLNPISGSPFATSNYANGNANYIVAQPSGEFLLSGDSDGSIATYCIHSTTGALSLMAKTSGPSSCGLQVIDPTGNYLYDFGIDVCQINQSSGVVNSVAAGQTYPFPTSWSPTSVAIFPAQ